MTAAIEIKSVVRAKYGAIAAGAARGCGCAPTCCGEGALDMIGDAYADLAGYVADADLGLGCGVPTRLAGIEQGDVVLDLGSGAGIDAFIARRSVGEAGRVIGVDLTEAMIERARANAAKIGYGNVEFRLGEIEHLPVQADTIDVVISNCVLNLVPEKAKAFAETWRVLKPGGHFCVSDIIGTAPLPDGIRMAAALCPRPNISQSFARPVSTTFASPSASPSRCRTRSSGSTFRRPSCRLFGRAASACSA
jgi:arsenite methyltransferase